MELLDSPYLAVLLRVLSEKQVRGFVDVAIVPDDPPAGTRQQPVPELPGHNADAEPRGVTSSASKARPLFPDGKDVRHTRATLMRALYNSRGPMSATGARILRELRKEVRARRPFEEVISGTDLRSLDHNGLATLARELHDRVLQGCPGYEDALTDMVTILNQLAPNTAASIYLGLLSSMYLSRSTNRARVPPSSPVAELLLSARPVVMRCTPYTLSQSESSITIWCPCMYQTQRCPRLESPFRPCRRAGLSTSCAV